MQAHDRSRPAVTASHVAGGRHVPRQLQAGLKALIESHLRVHIAVPLVYQVRLPERTRACQDARKALGVTTRATFRRFGRRTRDGASSKS